MSSISFSSPLGPLTVVEENGAIVELDWTTVKGQTETDLLIQTRDELLRFFDGK